ncbi:MAG: hypothetical protein KH452_13525 [Clostridiales bacterium]|nr:hypothetical protein [Clostridiales bacterium]
MNIGLKLKKERKEQSETGTQTRERYTPSRLRRHRRLSRREWLVLLIPALAAIAAVVIVLLVFQRGSSYEFQSAGTQYYGGTAGRVEEGAVLSLERSGAVRLEQKGQDSEATLPIYIDDTRKVVIPVDMIYYVPRSGTYDRVAGLSEIECKANGTITVKRGGKSAQPEQGFLYDGGNFYLFLEPMTVSFNGYTVEVPALSYVEATYGGYMMLFNYDTKEFIMELSDGTGTAQPASGDYVISLMGDSMTKYDGSRSLLVTQPELFDPLV